MLPRLIGASRAFDILLTGRTVNSQEAERIGLVSRIVPDGQGLTAALEMAEKMCRLSPYALKMTKRTLWANLEIPGMEAAIDLENRNQLLLGLTNNLPECITARKEKRDPVYEDNPRVFE